MPVTTPPTTVAADAPAANNTTQVASADPAMGPMAAASAAPAAAGMPDTTVMGAPSADPATGLPASDGAGTPGTGAQAAPSDGTAAPTELAQFLEQAAIDRAFRSGRSRIEDIRRIANQSENAVVTDLAQLFLGRGHTYLGLVV